MSSYLTTAPPDAGAVDRDGLVLGQFPMDALLAGCVENLLSTYARERGLFPYKTTLVEDRFVSDYEHPQAVRYTINSLLGLAEAARYGITGVSIDQIDGMTARFVDRRADRLDTLADVGLLAVLLADYGGDASQLDQAVTRLRALLATGRRPSLDLQTLSWSVWGTTAAARQGVSGAEEVALRLADVIRDHFVDREARLPRHSTRWYRRGIVSFGSITYFLRAAHELATTFDDGKWRRAFVRGVEWALEHQGPLGEWPWLMDVRSGLPVDPYPVFSVHQDSMAMLFLLPALDDGVPGVATSVEQSLAWGFGANELGTRFYLTDPFLAYRSIERAERAPRLRRYGRAAASRLRRHPATLGARHVRVNQECRSYHLGWILYAWAARVGSEVPARPAPDV